MFVVLEIGHKNEEGAMKRKTVANKERRQSKGKASVSEVLLAKTLVRVWVGWLVGTPHKLRHLISPLLL
jgi:hypothetical protein